MAIENGQVDIVQALLKAPGIDLAARDGHGDTALKIAVEDSFPSPIIDALLAAQGINARSEEFLVRHIEFLAAAEAGDLVQVRSLLASIPWLDVNFEKRDQTALKLAVGQSHLEVVQELPAMPGIFVDRDTCAQIAHLAAQKGHLFLLRLMLGMPGFDVNKGYGKVPYLVTAAKNGQLAIVHALLAAPGIKVNARASDGPTVLLAACWKDNYCDRINLPNCHASGCESGDRCQCQQ